MQVSDMSGLLFPNKDKTKAVHPNLKGTVVIEGVEYWASAWVKYDKNNNKFLSLAFQPKEQQQGKVQKALDDYDIPF
jgi:hypothetical protein